MHIFKKKKKSKKDKGEDKKEEESKGQQHKKEKKERNETPEEREKRRQERKEKHKMKQEEKMKEAIRVTKFDDLPERLIDLVINSGFSYDKARDPALLETLVTILFYIKSKQMIYCPLSPSSSKEEKNEEVHFLKKSKHDMKKLGLPRWEEVFDSKTFSATKKSYKDTTCLLQGKEMRVYTGKRLKGKKKEDVLLKIRNRPHHRKEKYTILLDVHYLRACDHPNIAKYEAGWLHSDSAWVALDVGGANGKIGSEMLRSKDLGSFTEANAAFVTKELLVALQHLHSRNLVHRNLSLETVLVSRSGEIRLFDLSDCAHIEGRAQKEAAGNAFAMAPEMLNHKPYGKEVDVWSLGVCVLDLVLGGKTPLKKSSGHGKAGRVKAMLEVATGGYPRPLFESEDDWSSELRDLLNGCLETDPDKRLTVDQVLGHGWLTKAATQKEFTKFYKAAYVQHAMNDMGGLL